MSVVSQLSTELTNLVSESRRRNSEIKHAAERSLGILKTQGGKSNEATFLKELSMSPDFITPFLLSCSTRNAKFSTIAIQCLNKLILSRAIPISKLDLLLDAFIEATHLAVDIQLKVLQTLPTLFQIYGEFINNGLVAKLLLICSMLQAPSKIPMVINTSAATQQQIVLSLFDKVIEDDKNDTLKEYTVKIDDDENLKIISSAYDAYCVLNDLCSLIEHQPPTFLTFKVMSESFGFELLENVLTNYQNVFLLHTELGFLVRTRITPLLLRSFSNSKDFLILVRVSRIMLLLIRTQISILEIETEVMLSLLTHVISKDSNVPYWKKVLSLEIFNGVMSDFELIKYIFSCYDYHEDKKKIIHHFLNVCSEIVKEGWASRTLRINDIVMVQESEHTISASNAALKIPYIELLDKNEAPPAPKAYTLYLILSCINSFSEGVGNFVRKISTNDSNTFSFLSELPKEEQESSNIDQLKALVISNAKSIVSIGAEFLYASLENELFHALIRALQKLCHASGVLGLDAQRDSLLMLFSIATISNNMKRNAKSLSIGETIVETFNNTIVSPPVSPSVQKFHPRYLNPRHIICFRALVSLAISLGPTLNKSWKFILSTFQWFDYYLNGPSEYLSFKELPPKPEVANNDLKSAEISFMKLFESTVDYDDRSFGITLNEIIGLARSTAFEPINTAEPIIEDKILLCPYNRDFFIKKLIVISKVNAKRFLEKDNEYWGNVVKFLSDVCASQEVLSDLRVSACATFNQSTKDLAAVAFSSNSSSGTVYTETELLDSLARIVDRMLSSMGETQFSTSESEMIHDTLKTLYELLDRFGTRLSHSWEAVIHIVDCPFKLFEVSKNAGSQKQLLKSSFEILELVLNDFLQTIPLKMMIKIIDVLQKFCSQQYELNISFSAISYYWLISDYFRQSSPELSESKVIATSKKALLDQLDTSEDNYIQVHALWLYLLSSIVEVSNDTREEVRNGAMHTFFRIVESHGSYLDWDRTYHIVVLDLLKVKFGGNPPDNREKNSEYKGSVPILLKGLTELYCRFFIHPQNKTYWEGLLGCFQTLVGWNITEVTYSVYKSLNQIVSAFDYVDSEVYDLLFDFWGSQSIVYVVQDTDTYQKCLEELIGSFRSLYKLSHLSISQLERALSIFNNAIRFPFLPRFTKDVQKPTSVQLVVLENLEIIDVTETPDILSLMLSHMSTVIILPFQTRSKILKKLKGRGKVEVPSFIASSDKALSWLEQTLISIEDYSPLLSNKSFLRVFKGLLDVVQSKVDDDKIQYDNILEHGLWKKALSSLLLLSSKVIPLLEKEVQTEESRHISSQIWDQVIESTISCLPVANDIRDEKFNLTLYKGFKEYTLSHIEQSVISNESIDKLVSSVWKSSFLYENDEIEKHLLENMKTPAEITKSLLSTKVNDYTTEPIKDLPQQKLRMTCLYDLFIFSDLKNLSDTNTNGTKKLATKALPYLLCRLVLSLKKFAGSQKLLNHAPVSSVQQQELNLSLERLYLLVSRITDENIETYKTLLCIYPYVLDNITALSRNKGIEILLRKITSELYRLSISSK